jgi:hypothetical protein
MRDDSSSARDTRPIRPFMVGMTAGATWAGLHVPQAIDAASAAELAAVALAIAIVCGGVLALVTEFVGIGIRLGRSRLHYGR